ncbi:MAG TPA: hypothetical protein VH062_03200 [Polyangiaceae bacterium]|jgi:hypothetical protein|nr:hypothetical protein [Polyangiaceae bacterium]
MGLSETRPSSRARRRVRRHAGTIGIPTYPHATPVRHVEVTPERVAAGRKIGEITQSRERGIGAWSDGELAYLLRTGVRPDGRYVPRTW